VKKISSRNERAIKIVIEYGQNKKELVADVADTPELIAKGFIGAKEIKNGLLFMGMSMQAFHMRGVNFPLSIAFIQEDVKVKNYKIIGKEEMVPGEKIYFAPEMVPFVLEMPENYFKKIPIGASITFSVIKK